MTDEGSSLGLSHDFLRLPLFPPIGRATALASASAMHIQRKCDACADEDQAIQAKHVEMASFPVQAKLFVSAPGDHLEREADRVANAVTREGTDAVRVPSHLGPLQSTQRRCTGYDEESKRSTVMRDAPGGTGSGALRADTAARLEAVRGGLPLPARERSYFEDRFGADFRQVRVHTGPAAEAATGAIHAQAYTRGSDIVFARGRYAPGTAGGRWLIAHELAHVIQQGGARQTLQQTFNNATVREQQTRPGAARQCEVGPGPFPGDGLAPPGDCSWAEYLPLLAAKESAAIVVGRLGACRAGDGCELLALKIAAISAEVAARLAREAKCFRGGDRGHRIQICDKVNMMMRCYRHFSGSNCSQELIAVMELVVAALRAAIVVGAAALTIALVVALIYAIIALVEVIAVALAGAAAAAAEAIVVVLAALVASLV